MDGWVQRTDEGYFKEIFMGEEIEEIEELDDFSYEELDGDLKQEEEVFNSIIFENWIIIEECWDDDPVFEMISCNIRIFVNINSYNLIFI